MPVIDHIDGATRRIYLHSDSVSLGLTSFDTFYREYRDIRESDTEMQVFYPFLAAEGNVPKGNSKFTPRYIKLLHGCRIVPYDTTHVLTVTFEILTDDEKSGVDCFDRLPLSITSRVDINYDYKGFEVIQIATGGSALTIDEHNKLMALQSGISEARLKQCLYKRENTIQNKRITSYVAGGDTVVNVTYDTDGIPASEEIS